MFGTSLGVFGIKLFWMILATGLFVSCASGKTSSREQLCKLANDDLPSESSVLKIGKILASAAQTSTEARAAPMGPEDFVAIKESETSRRWRLFVSLTDRERRDSDGTIGTVIFDEENGFNIKSVASVLPSELRGKFHPIGLTVAERDDGRHHLYVINTKGESARSPGKHTNLIERFKIDAATLIRQEPIEDETFVSPNDLLVIGDDIYLSNPRLPNLLRGSYFWRWPSLVHYHESEASIDTANTPPDGRQFGFANGIVASPDGKFVLVAAFKERKVVVYSRMSIDGTLKLHNEIDFEEAGHPDNLMLSEDGKYIYAAVHKSFLDTF